MLSHDRRAYNTCVYFNKATTKNEADEPFHTVTNAFVCLGKISLGGISSLFGNLQLDSKFCSLVQS